MHVSLHITNNYWSVYTDIDTIDHVQRYTHNPRNNIILPSSPVQNTGKSIGLRTLVYGEYRCIYVFLRSGRGVYRYNFRRYWHRVLVIMSFEQNSYTEDDLRWMRLMTSAHWTLAESFPRRYFVRCADRLGMVPWPGDLFRDRKRGREGSWWSRQVTAFLWLQNFGPINEGAV